MVQKIQRAEWIICHVDECAASQQGSEMCSPTASVISLYPPVLESQVLLFFCCGFWSADNGSISLIIRTSNFLLAPSCCFCFIQHLMYHFRRCNMILIYLAQLFLDVFQLHHLFCGFIDNIMWLLCVLASLINLGFALKCLKPLPKCLRLTGWTKHTRTYSCCAFLLHRLFRVCRVYRGASLQYFNHIQTYILAWEEVL